MTQKEQHSNNVKLTGAILAGGKSRRMGQPKEGMRLSDGRTMIEHVIDALRPLCEKIVIVGESRGFLPPPDSKISIIPDRLPQHGPIGGLEALLTSGDGTHYLLAACDQPLLEAELLKRLIEAYDGTPTFFRPLAEDLIDPFPCVLPADWLGDVNAAIERGDFSMHNLIRRSNVQWVDLPDLQRKQLGNVNTPHDLNNLTH